MATKKKDDEIIRNLQDSSWVIDRSNKDNPKKLQFIEDDITAFDSIDPKIFLVHKSNAQFVMQPGVFYGGKGIPDYLPVNSPPFQPAVVYSYGLPIADLEVKINKEPIVSLNYKLEELYNEIEKSKYILNLKDNFDEEGSEGYKKETWIRAIGFIARLFEFALIKGFVKIPQPKIYHGPSGSIDIYWENEDFNLLINIPKLNTKLASYSGENTIGEKVKGEFDDSKINYGLILLFTVLK